MIFMSFQFGFVEPEESLEENIVEEVIESMVEAEELLEIYLILSKELE